MAGLGQPTRAIPYAQREIVTCRTLEEFNDAVDTARMLGAIDIRWRAYPGAHGPVWFLLVNATMDDTAAWPELRADYRPLDT